MNSASEENKAFVFESIIFFELGLSLRSLWGYRQ